MDEKLSELKRAIVEAMDEPVFICNQDGELFLINNAAAKLLNRNLNAAESLNLYHFICDDGSRQKLARLFENVCSGKEPAYQEINLTCAAQIIALQLKILNCSGYYLLIGNPVDLTREELQNELSKANNEAANLNRELNKKALLLERNMERERNTQESLRESEEKHRRLFETMAQGVIYQDADGAIISANPAAERFLGLSFEQMQGKTSMDPHWQMIKEDGTAVPGADHPTMLALRTGQKVGPLTRGVFHPEKNSHVWLNITAIPLFQPGKLKPFQVYATFEDITARKQAEQSLQESNKRCRDLLEQTSDLVWELDQAYKFTYINPRVADITGFSPAELLHTSLFDFLKPEEAQKLLLKSRQQGPDPFECTEFVILNRRGQPVILETSGVPFFDRQGSLLGYRGISRDITLRKEAAAEAVRLEALRAMENERMRLARDLHDEIGMLLSTLKLDLQMLSTRYPTADTNIQSSLSNSIKKMDDSIIEVRHKSAALRPPALDTLGLRLVLETMLEELGQRSGVQTSLQFSPGEPDLGPELKNTLYRCIQEALTNTARHAFASNTVVELGWDSEQVKCIITDDGIGFNSDAVRDDPSGHLGLLGMKERIFLVKGTIEIHAAPGRGTKISITIPLKRS